MVDIVFSEKRVSAKKGKIPTLTLLLQEESDAAGKALKLFPTGAQEFSVGLGPAKTLDAEGVRRAAGKAVGYLQSTLQKDELLLSASSSRKLLTNRELLAAFVEGAILASYSFSKYKTSETGAGGGSGKENSTLRTLHLPVPARDEILAARVLAEGTNWAREVENEPANIATPTMLALLAAREAKVLGLTCRIYSRNELEKMGFGAMLAVAKGSAEEPKLIVMEYLPKSGVARRKVAVVGKGVCFDSGGISIKPSKAMDEMKFDKSGGVTAIGIARVAALLKLPVHLLAIVPVVENMPSGTATKPGDIVKSYSGKTIEILDTDAEGRLILADALSFACKEHKPDVVIDLATLTGACVVALGDVAAGLFSNDETLGKDLFRAGLESGELLWELPMMWHDYDEKVKSDVADIKNLGQERQAGATAGASFLKYFVDARKWAHLDIAGTAWVTSPKHFFGRGATGFGIRLITRYLQGAGREK
jgi:leucyl aminopeptidase